MHPPRQKMHPLGHTLILTRCWSDKASGGRSILHRDYRSCQAHTVSVCACGSPIAASYVTPDRKKGRRWQIRIWGSPGLYYPTFMIPATVSAKAMTYCCLDFKHLFDSVRKTFWAGRQGHSKGTKNTETILCMCMGLVFRFSRHFTLPHVAVHLNLKNKILKFSSFSLKCLTNIWALLKSLIPQEV